MRAGAAAKVFGEMIRGTRGAGDEQHAAAILVETMDELGAGPSSASVSSRRSRCWDCSAACVVRPRGPLQQDEFSAVASTMSYECFVLSQLLDGRERDGSPGSLVARLPQGHAQHLGGGDAIAGATALSSMVSTPVRAECDTVPN